MSDGVPIRLSIILDGRNAAVSEASNIIGSIGQNIGEVSRNIDNSMRSLGEGLAVVIGTAARSMQGAFTGVVTELHTVGNALTDVIGRMEKLANTARSMGVAMQAGVSPIGRTATGDPNVALGREFAAAEGTGGQLQGYSKWIPPSTAGMSPFEKWMNSQQTGLFDTSPLLGERVPAIAITPGMVSSASNDAALTAERARLEQEHREYLMRASGGPLTDGSILPQIDDSASLLAAFKARQADQAKLAAMMDGADPSFQERSLAEMTTPTAGESLAQQMRMNQMRADHQNSMMDGILDIPPSLKEMMTPGAGEAMSQQMRMAEQASRQAAALQGMGGFAQYGQQVGRGGLFSPGFQEQEQRGNIQTATRAAGLFNNAQTLKLNVDTGELETAIHKGTSDWEQFIARIVGTGGTVSKTFNGIGAVIKTAFSPLTGAFHLWESIGNQMIRVSAIFYSFERIGNLVKGAILGPFEAIDKASENALKFRQAISGTVGGMGNAGIIDDSVIAASRNSSLTLAQSREAARGLTDIAPVASQMSLSTPEMSSQLITKLLDIENRIAIQNPNASQDAIVKSVENALLGNLRGLRLTARIDPTDLQAVSGLSQKGLQGNQEALINAISSIMKNRVGDFEVSARQNLPSVQWEKFTEQFEVAMQRIGADSGLLGTIASRFHSMMEEIAGYIDSAEFRVKAKAIGEDLMHVFDNLMGAGRNFLTSMVGDVQGSSEIDKIAGQIKLLTGAFADMSDNLNSGAGNIGEIFGKITSTVVDWIAKIAGVAEDALQFQANWKTAHGALEPGGLHLGGGDPNATANLLNRMVGGGAALWSSSGYIGNPTDEDGNPVGKQLPRGFIDEANAATSGYRLDPRTYADGKNPNDYEFISQNTLAQKIIPIAEKFGVTLDGLNQFYLQGTKQSGADGPIFSTRKQSQQDYLNKAYQLSLARQDKAYDDLGVTSGDPFFNTRDSVARSVSTWGGGDKAGEKLDKFSAALEQITNQSRTIFSKSDIGSGVAGDVFQNMDAYQKRRVGELQSQYQDVYSQSQEHSITAERAGTLNDRMEAIDLNIRNLLEGLPDAKQKLADEMVAGARNAFMQLFDDAAKNKNSIIGSAQIQELMAGAMPYQRDLAANFKRSGVAGGADFASLTLDQQAAILPIAQEKYLNAIRAQGALNQTPQGSSLLFGAGMQSQELAAYQSQRGQDVNLLNRATKDGDAQAMLAAKEAIIEVDAKIVELQNSLNLARQGFIDFGNSAQQSLTSGIGEALTDIETKTGKVSDAFRKMGLEILKSFNQNMSKFITGSIFGPPGQNSGIGGGLLGGLFNGFGHASGTSSQHTDGPPASNGGGNQDGQYTSWIASILGKGLLPSAIQGISGLFASPASESVLSTIPAEMASVWAADGAVFEGGFTAFASGGIAHKPTLGLIGERHDKVPEAVIPLLGSGGRIPLGFDGSGLHAKLPGGRTISASMEGGYSAFASGGVMGHDHWTPGAGKSGGGGGADQHLTIINLADKNEIAQHTMNSHGKTLVNNVLSEFRTGGKGRRILNKN